MAELLHTLDKTLVQRSLTSRYKKKTTHKLLSFQHSKRSDNKRCTVKVRWGIFIENLTYFFIPKSGCKYSHTNSYNFAMTPISQDDHFTTRAWAACQFTCSKQNEIFVCLSVFGIFSFLRLIRFFTRQKGKARSHNWLSRSIWRCILNHYGWIWLKLRKKN